MECLKRSFFFKKPAAWCTNSIVGMLQDTTQTAGGFSMSQLMSVIIFNHSILFPEWLTHTVRRPKANEKNTSSSRPLSTKACSPVAGGVRLIGAPQGLQQKRQWRHSRSTWASPFSTYQLVASYVFGTLFTNSVNFNANTMSKHINENWTHVASATRKIDADSKCRDSLIKATYETLSSPPCFPKSLVLITGLSFTLLRIRGVQRSPSDLFSSMCYVRHPPPHQAEGKTMAAFVCPPTLHHWGLGWFCISVGQKRVQPHSRLCQLEISLEWHKKKLAFERQNRDRLAITVSCPLPWPLIFCVCSNVVSLTQSHDTSLLIFLRQTIFWITVINWRVLHSVTESVTFGTKQWGMKKMHRTQERAEDQSEMTSTGEK